MRIRRAVRKQPANFGRSVPHATPPQWKGYPAPLDFDIVGYKDRYEERLPDLLTGKTKALPVMRPDESKPTNVINLVDVQEGGKTKSAPKTSQRTKADRRMPPKRSHRATRRRRRAAEHLSRQRRHTIPSDRNRGRPDNWTASVPDGHAA